MEIREELNYVKSHEWVKEEGEVVTIGLTDYAQSELGDLVFVNLPEEGDEVSVGEAFGDVESVKAVSDVYSPVSGVVCEYQRAVSLTNQSTSTKLRMTHGLSKSKTSPKKRAVIRR